MLTPNCRYEESIRPQLPPNVAQVLDEFVAGARAAFATDLVAAVLFGSAAEGRLRPASDVNLILVIRAFTAEHAAAIESRLRFVEAAIRLRVMFLKESEIAAAAEAFAQKFADIAARHAVVWAAEGKAADPFGSLIVPREALARQVEQVLLNLSIRLRERAAADWPREDVLARELANAIGPLRACAQSLLELEGRTTDSPKTAFAEMIARPGAPHPYLAGYYSSLRERTLPPSGSGVTVSAALLATMELIDWMRSFRRTSNL